MTTCRTVLCFQFRVFFFFRMSATRGEIAHCFIRTIIHLTICNRLRCEISRFWFLITENWTQFTTFLWCVCEIHEREIVSPLNWFNFITSIERTRHQKWGNAWSNCIETDFKIEEKKIAILRCWKSSVFREWLQTD